MPAECCAEGEKPAECCEADKACPEGEACDKPCCEDKAACDKHCEEAAAAAPVSTHKEKVPANIPVAAILLVLCGLCTSVMWGTIFDLSVEGLGTATEKASGIFMAMVVGGGILPLIQNFVADKAGYMTSYWVLVLGVAFILYFAIIGSKVKKN
jgi:FHS family L-fucose permease-like MFS transporter